MKLLIDIESPYADSPRPGEPALAAEIEAFTRKLVESRRLPGFPKVSVLTVDPNWVLVDADALGRLQKKAGLKA